VVIERDYLLKKPVRPSAPKLLLDTQVVPLAVNIAGGLEVALDRASVRTGIRPAVILTGVTGVVFLALFRVLSGGVRKGRAANWSGIALGAISAFTARRWVGRLRLQD
jgi:hypothetical protein